jgi:hypothetical protein
MIQLLEDVEYSVQEYELDKYYTSSPVHNIHNMSLSLLYKS